MSTQAKNTKSPINLVYRDKLKNKEIIKSRRSGDGQTNPGDYIGE
jgi:hypothetical protein